MGNTHRIQHTQPQLRIKYQIPDAPCMDYLPPSGENGTCKAKCREIFPTCSIWVSIDSYANCVLCPHELSANHSDIFRAFHLTPFCAGFSKRCVLWGEIFPFQKTRVLVVSPPSLPLGRIPPGESLPWLLEDQISCIFFRSRLGLVSDG